MPKRSFWAAWLSALFCAAAAADPNAYVVNEGSASVSIVDTETEKVSATIKVGERPRGLAVSPGGERIYVSLEDGTLVEYDMYERVESGRAMLGRLPSSITVSPDGKSLVAAINGDGEVVLLELAQMRIAKKIPVPGGKHATNAVFSPDGRWIYVSADDSPEVAVIDARQGAVASSIHVGPRLRGIAFLPGG